MTCISSPSLVNELMVGICSALRQCRLALRCHGRMCVGYVLRRVIGYMVMEDEKGQDEKVRCALPLPVPLWEAREGAAD